MDFLQEPFNPRSPSRLQWAVDGEGVFLEEIVAKEHFFLEYEFNEQYPRSEKAQREYG